MRTKEAKAKALKEGLKNYLGNLTGKRVRDAKKTREAVRSKAAKESHDAWNYRDSLRAPKGDTVPGSFEDHIMSNRALAIENRALRNLGDADRNIRSLTQSRDKARAGTALVAGGGLLAMKKKKKKGKKKEASIESLSPSVLVPMREEFERIFDREAEQVEYKVAKAGLLENIKQRISQ